MVDVLLNSNLAQLNLEFQGIGVYNNALSSLQPIWKRCGDKIRDLCFINCVPKPENFEEMILYCEEVTSLRITLRSGCRDVLFQVLNNCVEKSIKRFKLHTFEIQEPISATMLRKISSIFPNIKRFSCGGILPAPKKSPPYSEFLLQLESLNVFPALSYRPGNEPVLPMWPSRFHYFLFLILILFVHIIVMRSAKRDTKSVKCVFVLLIYR